MDVEKFKQLSGSMKQAFGVQREVKADEIPKGTSIITQEFSPGIPQPTPFQVVKQQTTDDTKDNLEVTKSKLHTIYLYAYYTKILLRSIIIERHLQSKKLNSYIKELKIQNKKIVLILIKSFRDVVLVLNWLRPIV